MAPWLCSPLVDRARYLLRFRETLGPDIQPPPLLIFS